MQTFRHFNARFGKFCMAVISVSIFGSGLFLSVAARSAPFPGMASSALSDPQKGLFGAQHGIEFHLTESSAWTLAQDPAWRPEEASWLFILQPELKRPDSKLSFRLDKMGKSQDLTQLAKRWIREYPMLGFQWLQTKNVEINGQKALLVDFYQKSRAIQVRQILLREGQRLAVFTCSDKRDVFAQTVSDCNHVVQSFQWKN